jgi:hypothetical protein
MCIHYIYIVSSVYGHESNRMIWIAVSTVVIGTLRAVGDAVRYIVEMDDALTDLSKVTTFTTRELNEMKDSAVDLGRELGRSSVDIMKAFAEFGRVSKVKEDIEELSRVKCVPHYMVTYN